MKKTIWIIGLSIALTTAFVACVFDPESPASGSDSPEAFLKLTVQLNANRSTLTKTAAKDTIFNLDSLKIIFTAPGTSTQTYLYPITGRPDTGAINVTPEIYPLPALRNWKAKIFTLDTHTNPGRTDTVNMDSVNFEANAGDTVVINKTIDAVYSILRARFVSNSPSSLPYSVKYVRIRIDGSTVDSSMIGDTLKSVVFPAAATGFAVGSAGTILRTTNTAANWTPQTSGSMQSLNSISCFSTTQCWIAGDGGLILHTANGTSWTSQSSSTSQNLNSIYMQSATKGWAVGNNGVVIATTNGGTSWTTQSSHTSQNLNSIYMQSAKVGWIVGNSGTILTTASGTSWAAQNGGTSQKLNSVYFQNAKKGWAVGGAGVIIATTDGGSNWSAQTSGTSQNLNSVTLESAKIGWIVGDSGTVLNTSNGTSWSAQNSRTFSDLFSITYASATAVHATGELSTSMNTSNGGTAWNPVYLGTKSFDVLLAYKYLKANINHNLVLDAMDTLSGSLRGYQKILTLNINSGIDTTINPATGLTVCGGSHPACTP